MNRAFPPHCYYCDFNPFANVDSYERHIVTKHPHYPGYPGPGDMRELKIKPQGMEWEKELSESQILEIIRNSVSLADRKKKR